MPVVVALTWALALLSGRALPTSTLRLAELAIYLVLFAIGAIGEELGWQGHAVPALRRQLPALPAALLVGLAWAAWHTAPYLQTHRSAELIAWQSLQTVLCRIIIVWLCANAGCRLPAVAFHATLNVAEFSFPDHGPHCDPRATSAILAVGVVVVATSGPQLLARGRRPPPSSDQSMC